MMNLRAICAIGLLLGAPLAAQDGVPVYVFAQPDPSGLTDFNQRQRETSAIDIRRALEKKGLAVVDSPGAAAFTVEVLDSGKRSTGDKLAVFGVLKDEKRHTVRIKLSTAAYHLELEAHRGNARPDDDAEKSLAKAVEKWVKDNRALLEQYRTASPKAVR